MIRLYEPDEWNRRYHHLIDILRRYPAGYEETKSKVLRKAKGVLATFNIVNYLEPPIEYTLNWSCPPNPITHNCVIDEQLITQINSQYKPFNIKQTEEMFCSLIDRMFQFNYAAYWEYRFHLGEAEIYYCQKEWSDIFVKPSLKELLENIDKKRTTTHFNQIPTTLFMKEFEIMEGVISIPGEYSWDQQDITALMKRFQMLKEKFMDWRNLTDYFANNLPDWLKEVYTQFVWKFDRRLFIALKNRFRDMPVLRPDFIGLEFYFNLLAEDCSDEEIFAYSYENTMASLKSETFKNFVISECRSVASCSND